MLNQFLDFRHVARTRLGDQRVGPEIGDHTRPRSKPGTRLVALAGTVHEKVADRRLDIDRRDVFQRKHLELRVGRDGRIELRNQIDDRRHRLTLPDQQDRVGLIEWRDANRRLAGREHRLVQLVDQRRHRHAVGESQLAYVDHRLRFVAAFSNLLNQRDHSSHVAFVAANDKHSKPLDVLDLHRSDRRRLVTVAHRVVGFGLSITGLNCAGLNCAGLSCAGLNCAGLNCAGLSGRLVEDHGDQFSTPGGTAIVGRRGHGPGDVVRTRVAAQRSEQRHGLIDLGGVRFSPRHDLRRLVGRTARRIQSPRDLPPRIRIGSLDVERNLIEAAINEHHRAEALGRRQLDLGDFAIALGFDRQLRAPDLSKQVLEVTPGRVLELMTVSGSLGRKVDAARVERGGRCLVR